MNKKLINEDIQRMKYMFGYKPGKVISEQESEFNEFEFSDVETAPVKPDVKPDIDTPTRPEIHPEDDPLRPGRRTRPRPAPQADFDDEDEFEIELDGDDEDDMDFSMEFDDEDDMDFEDEDDMGFEDEYDDELFEDLSDAISDDDLEDDEVLPTHRGGREYNDDEYDY
jgi:hypothetical protein